MNLKSTRSCVHLSSIIDFVVTCHLCNSICQYCFMWCVLMYKLIELQPLVDILVHHRQTCGIAVKGASVRHAAKDDVDRPTKTLSSVRIVSKQHHTAALCHGNIAALQRTSYSNHSTYLQLHHPCSMERLSRPASWCGMEAAALRMQMADFQ